MAESARRALEECSELSYLNIGKDELIYVEASMTHPCGTECVLCTTHAQYRILCKKVKIFYRLNQGSNLKSSDVMSDVLPLHH